MQIALCKKHNAICIINAGIFEKPLRIDPRESRVDFGVSEIFCNFAVRFTKSRPIMKHVYSYIHTAAPAVRNWGFLENWKSTASR